MRHSEYMVMVSTQTEVELENLPQTERATYYHALRVYQQVGHLDFTCLNSLNWGWTLRNNSVVPVEKSCQFLYLLTEKLIVKTMLLLDLLKTRKNH